MGKVERRSISRSIASAWVNVGKGKKNFDIPKRKKVVFIEIWIFWNHLDPRVICYIVLPPCKKKKK